MFVIKGKYIVGGILLEVLVVWRMFFFFVFLWVRIENVLRFVVLNILWDIYFFIKEVILFVVGYDVMFYEMGFILV